MRFSRPVEGRVWTAQSALSRLLERLNFSDLSRRQALQYLQRKGCPEELARGAVEHCENLHILDDDRVAQGLLEKARRRGWSRQKLRQVEIQRGVSNSAELDESGCCRDLAQRWARLNLPPEKLMARLQRRGFSYSLVRRCLAELEATTPGRSD